MHAQAEATILSGPQNFLRLGNIEVAAFAKNVAVFSELFVRDARKHFVNDERDVLLWRVPKLVGHRVGAEKSRNEFDRRFGIEPANHAQQLQLVVDREAVTGL